ncbi:hypothetical protein B0T16DRAFT_392756 [Cercophora newfieldiana]|uniref:Cellobiose dehydrogenase-like cytochrome domain-containing protein n=1 Tax=Cercophora newfieldiana TaxID=92897 RepID=A0AA39Y3F8_9PEZI|nr:hypothetical protein B0T16DRAFT_392756 [Cercophora newfieldiana]
MATAALGQATSTSSAYHDPYTGIHFQRYASGNYSFSLVLPDNPSFATTDLIGQLVSPLSPDGDGWAGVSFGSKMMGPLLLVAWPTPSKSVIVSPRLAHGKSPDSVHVYDNHPVKVKQIPEGTFVNGTHVTATFLCEGCVNADSFDPRASQIWQFAWAWSQRRVAEPGKPDTALSDHRGVYGFFGVDLEGAKSTEFLTLGIHRLCEAQVWV